MTKPTLTDELVRRYAEVITTAQMVSIAAHDFGHKMFSLCALAEDLLRDLRSSAPRRVYAKAEELLQSAIELQRELETIQQIRRGSPMPTRFKIRDTVDRVFHALQGPLVRLGIVTRVRIAPGLTMFGAPHQLSMVLSNLTLNSIQALQNTRRGREISVEARQSSAPGGPGVRRVEILFGDTGPGIDSAFNEPDHIFKVGTTSYPGQAGFGLAVSRAIVERTFAGTLGLASATPAAVC